MSQTCNYGSQFASEKWTAGLRASASGDGLFVYIFKRGEWSGFEIKETFPPNLHCHKTESTEWEHVTFYKSVRLMPSEQGMLSLWVSLPLTLGFTLRSLSKNTSKTVRKPVSACWCVWVFLTTHVTCKYFTIWAVITSCLLPGNFGHWCLLRWTK